MPIAVIVIATFALVCGLLVWRSPAAPAPPTWPQVTRTVMPEDLDR